MALGGKVVVRLLVEIGKKGVLENDGREPRSIYKEHNSSIISASLVIAK